MFSDDRNRIFIGRNHHFLYRSRKPLVKRWDKRKSKPKRIDTYSQVPNINVTGLSQIFNDSNSLLKRTIWSITLLLFGTFCCYQIIMCFTNYFSFPTYLQTEVMNDEKMKFPALFVCPGLLRNIQYQFYQINQTCPESDSVCFLSDPYVKTVIKEYDPFDYKPPIEINKFWSSFAIKKSEISIYIPCVASEHATGSCSPQGRKLTGSGNPTVATFWGMCVVLEPSSKVSYQGPSLTYMKVMHTDELYGNVTGQLDQQLKRTKEVKLIESIKESISRRQISLLVSLFSRKKKNRQHLSFYRSIEILQGYETHMQLKKKHFSYSNKKEKPCVSDDEWMECYNDCIEKKMSKDCSMPYYTPNHLLRNCSWDKTFIHSHLKNSNAYSTFSFAGCNCSSSCNEIVYSVTLDVVDKLQNRSDTLFKIYFADQTFEQTTEKFAYTFAVCLSDIGGNLGFFLGISTLTCFEILDFILNCAAKRWKTK